MVARVSSLGRWWGTLILGEGVVAIFCVFLSVDSGQFCGVSFFILSLFPSIEIETLMICLRDTAIQYAVGRFFFLGVSAVYPRLSRRQVAFIRTLDTYGGEGLDPFDDRHDAHETSNHTSRFRAACYRSPRRVDASTSSHELIAQSCGASTGCK